MSGKTAAAEVDLDEAMRRKRVAAINDAATGKRGYSKRNKSILAKPSIFIAKAELTHHLQCSTSALRKWIAEGIVPPPYARISEKHPVWLRSHFDEFVRTTRWPKGAWDARA